MEDDICNDSSSIKTYEQCRNGIFGSQLIIYTIIDA